jgi:hypothetical protein
LVHSSDEGGVRFVLDCLVNPLLEGLIGAEEVPLLAREGSVGEEDRSGTKEARVDGLSFAQGAENERVSGGEVVPDVFGHNSSVHGGQLEVEEEGRVGVIGDPSFSRVVRKLLKEAGQTVVRGAICGGGCRRWGAVQLEG